MDQGPWPFPVDEHWLDTKQEIQARFIWGSSYMGATGTGNRFPYSLLGGQVSLYFMEVRVGCIQGWRWRGVLGESPFPLECWWGACAMPCSCPSASEVSGWGSLGPFVSFVLTLSQLHRHSVILVIHSFFVFCCWRKGLSRCNCCSSGSQPVSAWKTKSFLPAIVTHLEYWICFGRCRLAPISKTSQFQGTIFGPKWGGDFAWGHHFNVSGPWPLKPSSWHLGPLSGYHLLTGFLVIIHF